MLYLRNLVFFYFCAAFLFVSTASAQDVVMIASPDVSASSITASDIHKIFLGQKTTWKNGNKITFITLKDGPVHEAFLKRFLKYSVSQYNRFWKKQLFTGKGKIPTSVQSEAEMVSTISNAANAIGYVSSSTDLGKTKKLPVK